ncbi:MAG TPA: hypothetical protein VGH94_08310 [Acidimicrobiales bacterium]
MPLGEGAGWADDLEVASGRIVRVPWMLTWNAESNRPRGLRLLAGEVLDRLEPLNGSPIDSCVDVIEEHAVVWGLVAPDVVAVRVVDADGTEIVEPVLGPDLDGSSAFLVVLPPERDPVTVESITSDAGVIRREAGLPEPTGASDISRRVQVRVTNRDGGPARGTIVLEGSVDVEERWEYAVALDGDEVHSHFQLWNPRGGGGGGSRGPRPHPSETRLMGLGGGGTNGGTWHLQGWADPAVSEVVVHLRSGEQVRLPTAGRDLDAGFVVFAMALPDEARGLALDGHDHTGHRLARLHIRQHLSGIEASIEDHRQQLERAAEPVPAEVRATWEEVLGIPFVDHAPGDSVPADRAEVIQHLDRRAVLARWPARPLLLPPVDDPDHERWMFHARNHRGELNHSLGIHLVCYWGRDLPDQPDPNRWEGPLAAGAILLRQALPLVEPLGTPEPPNTSVRGCPAVLWEHTAAANGLDHTWIMWFEPEVGVAHGLGRWCSVEADPRRHSLEAVRRFVEDLAPFPG